MLLDRPQCFYIDYDHHSPTKVAHREIYRWQGSCLILCRLSVRYSIFPQTIQLNLHLLPFLLVKIYQNTIVSFYLENFKCLPFISYYADLCAERSLLVYVCGQFICLFMCLSTNRTLLGQCLRFFTRHYSRKLMGQIISETWKIHINILNCTHCELLNHAYTF